MREIRSEMQKFYLENNVIEYTLTFEQACNLMRSLSLKLQDAARLNTDLTILFVVAPNVEESAVYDNVLCKHVFAPLNVELTDKLYSQFLKNSLDRDEIANDYFNV